MKAAETSSQAPTNRRTRFVWYELLSVYLDAQQQQFWLHTLSHLERFQGNSDILSHLVNSLGLKTLVLHRLAERTAHLAVTIEQAGQSVAELNQSVSQTCLALIQNQQALKENNARLAILQRNITQAALPWGKVMAIGVLSAVLAVAAVANGDHLNFLRVPTGEDMRVKTLIDSDEFLRYENVGLRKQVSDLNLELQVTQNNVDLRTALQKEFDSGYAQGIRNTNPKSTGK